MFYQMIYLYLNAHCTKSKKEIYFLEWEKTVLLDSLKIWLLVSKVLLFSAHCPDNYKKMCSKVYITFYLQKCCKRLLA